MTKSEFQDLQVRAGSNGKTLKKFLQEEGVAYTTYYYCSCNTKAEAEKQSIAKISISNEPEESL